MIYARLCGPDGAFGWQRGERLTVGGLRPLTAYRLWSEAGERTFVSDARGAWRGEVGKSVALCIAREDALSAALYHEERLTEETAALFLRARQTPRAREAVAEAENAPPRAAGRGRSEQNIEAAETAATPPALQPIPERATEPAAARTVEAEAPSARPAGETAETEAVLARPAGETAEAEAVLARPATQTAEEKPVETLYRPASDGEPVDALPALYWPEKARRLRAYFESSRPQRLFALPGWRFVRVERENRQDCLGYRAENDRVVEVLYGVRGGTAAPGALKGSRYQRALDGGGYWVARQSV